MTNTQAQMIAKLTANVESAKQAGLLVKMTIEDCEYFMSVQLRIEHDRENIEVTRNGHYNEIYTHLMIGKRGGVDGTARIGSIFGGNEYTSKESNGVFKYLVRDSFKTEIGYMIDFAQKYNEVTA